MKTQTARRNVEMKKLYILLGLISSLTLTGAAFAQDRVVNYDDQPILVDGRASDPTDEELDYIVNELDKQGNQINLNKQKSDKYRRLQLTTEKLANTTERYVKEKNNSQRKIEEYNKKIDCLLNESTDPDCDQFREGDQVHHKQAAQKSQAPVKQSSYVEKIRITPFVVATSYSGNGLNNVEANPGFGIRLDADITKSFAFGIGVSKISMQANNLRCAGTFGMNCFGANGLGMHGGFGMNPMLGMGAMGGFGGPMGWNQMGRNVAMDNLTVDLMGRYNIAIRDQFVPYVGFGIGYNRMSLEFQDQFNFGQMGMMSPMLGMGGFGMNPFMDQVYTTTFFTAKASVGADYYFTKMFGVNLEFGYARGIANPNDRTNTPGFHMILENIADQIAGANALSAQMGVIIAF